MQREQGARAVGEGPGRGLWVINVLLIAVLRDHGARRWRRASPPTSGAPFRYMGKCAIMVIIGTKAHFPARRWRRASPSTSGAPFMYMGKCAIMVIIGTKAHFPARRWRRASPPTSGAPRRARGPAQPRRCQRVRRVREGWHRKNRDARAAIYWDVLRVKSWRRHGMGPQENSSVDFRMVYATQRLRTSVRGPA
jgi:hypothetical protein